MTKESWGKKLAAARRALGWTQEDLAERLSVSRQAVAKWERGLSVPDVRHIHTLQSLLGEQWPGSPQEDVSDSCKPQHSPFYKCWLILFFVLCLFFCGIALFSAIYTAFAGIFLLFLLFTGFLAASFYLLFHNRPFFSAARHFLYAFVVLLLSLGVSFLFSLFLWAYGTHYRLDLIAPISPDVLSACPALTASMQGWHLSDDSPYILCYGTAVGTERISERYLLETHGVKGVSKVKIHPFQQQIQLIWESDSAADTQYYLIQCSGAKNFHLTMTLKGENEQIELFAAAPDESTLSAWGSELETLWNIYS